MKDKTPIENAVDEFIAYCEAACAARQESNPNYCKAYTDRGRSCTDCPREWSDELQTMIVEKMEKAAQTTPEEDPRQTKMPFAVDKTPAQLAQERDEKELEEAWERIDSDFTREQQCRDEMMGGHL